MTQTDFVPDVKYEGTDVSDKPPETNGTDTEVDTEKPEDEYDPDEALEVLTSPVGAQPLTPTGVEQKRETTRGLLATIFIVGFFIMLGAGFLLAAINDLTLSEKSKSLQDILLTISGVLSGPLGFVVGYYFRKGDETDNTNV